MGDESLGPLVILESETGSGKTEAALWRYLRLFRAGEVDSLYFALPTRVAASQLYKRVQDTLDRLWPENPPLALRALPGYVAADGQEARALPDFKVLWATTRTIRRPRNAGPARTPSVFSPPRLPSAPSTKPYSAPCKLPMPTCATPPWLAACW
jgi:CRISPR-associated endonuclease/helicase Cas3